MVKQLFWSKLKTPRRRNERKPAGTLANRAGRDAGLGCFSGRVEMLEGRQVLAAFTSGNLVVERIGNGSTTLASAAFNVAIQEFSPAGSAVQTISFGSTAGATDLLTDSKARKAFETQVANLTKFNVWVDAVVELRNGWYYIKDTTLKRF
jgi:hypothetical protein